MATTTKLIVFNAALRALGSHPLANLTSPNPALLELSGAFDHAVEYALTKAEWNFARRRALLTGTEDVSFDPFLYRYNRPSDYLRKVWIKSAAGDDSQVPHAEIGAVIYGDAATARIEYISDSADNYDPANWPPAFTRGISLYLAYLVAPKLARAGDAAAKLAGEADAVFAEAASLEAVYTQNGQIPASHQPTLRRALEILGAHVDGSVDIMAQADYVRWNMDKAWDHAVRYCLSQGAWNFATKRAVFHDGLEGDADIEGEGFSGIIEGYSLGPAAAAADLPSMSGYDWSFQLPDDFLHKIWLKIRADSLYEIHHQIIGRNVFINETDAVMEYVAESAFTTNPANWPPMFLEVIASWLAATAAPKMVIERGKGGMSVVAGQVHDKCLRQYQMALSNALIKDAIQQEPKMIPPGRFVNARRSGRSGSWTRRG